MIDFCWCIRRARCVENVFRYLSPSVCCQWWRIFCRGSVYSICSEVYDSVCAVYTVAESRTVAGAISLIVVALERISRWYRVVDGYLSTLLHCPNPGALLATDLCFIVVRLRVTRSHAYISISHFGRKQGLYRVWNLCLPGSCHCSRKLSNDLLSGLVYPRTANC